MLKEYTHDVIKRVYIVLNPASGKSEPILFYINSLLKDKVEWDMGLTKKRGDGYRLAKKALRQRYDAIVVYGGDGTVMEVAAALFRRKTPLVILPGGTTNLLAKEIGVPNDSQEALKLLLKKRKKLKKIDMGMMDGIPFAVGIAGGFIAEVMKSTQRNHKNRFGRGAYAIAALKEIRKETKPATYTIHSDGKTETVTGYALMVTNTANLGIAGLTIADDISLDDGKLDLLVIKELALSSAVEVAKPSWLSQQPMQNVLHIRSKKFKIEMSPEQLIECDDIFEKYDSVTISAVKKGLTLIVP